MADRPWQPRENPRRRHGEHDADDEAEADLTHDEQDELVEALRVRASIQAIRPIVSAIAIGSLPPTRPRASVPAGA